MNKLLFSFAAVFALIAQPMYGLVASQVANAASSTCEANTEQSLNDCIGTDGVDTVNLTGNITTTKQVSINKSLTVNGNSHAVTANFTHGGVNNDAVFGIYGVGNTATFNNIIIDGGGVSKDLHGVDLYISNAVLNDVTIQNTARTAININGSHVTVDNLTTINTARKKNWLGAYTFNVMELAMGGGVTREPVLTIKGKSSHNETAFINGNHIKISSGTVNDNDQYSSGNMRNLKRTIDAPTIAAPTEAATIVDSNAVTLTWSAVNGSNTTQAAAKYNYRLSGVSQDDTPNTSVTETLANGTYELEVQAVSASGLTSNWSAVRKFTVDAPQPLNAPVIKGFTHDKSDRAITTRTSGQWINTNGTSPNTMHMQWNTGDYDLSKVKATKFEYKTPGSDWKPGATYLPGSANFITSWIGGVFSKHGEGMYEFKLALQNELGEWSDWSNIAELGYDETEPIATITAPTGPVDTTKPFTIEGTFSDNLSGVGRLHLYLSANGKEIANPFIVPASQLNSVGGNFTYTLTDADVARLNGELTIGDGDVVTIRANVHDNANNYSNVISTITSDTAAPIVTILREFYDKDSNTSGLIGTIDDATAQVTVTVNGQEFTLADDDFYTENGVRYWLLGFVGPWPVDEYAVSAKAIDAVGNESAASYSFTINLEPTIAIPATPTPANPVVAPVATPVPSAVASQVVAQLPTETGDAAEDAADTPRVLGDATTKRADSSEGQVLGDKDVRKEWSLMNVALAGVAALLAIIALAGIRKGGRVLRVLTVVAAVGAVVAVILLEDFSAKLGWFNIWTILLAVIVIAQIALLANAKPVDE